ncbi:FHIPEP family type III secretion protein [Escherichia coli]
MLRLPANLQIDTMANPCRTDLILLILSMMVLPLPAFISTCCYLQYCLVDHGVAGGDVYPARFSLLRSDHSVVSTTLLRLALNVASTRIILMEGHAGAAAAGKVVEAFGHFLVGGDFAIGIVRVCRSRDHRLYGHYQKGAGRIAEWVALF